MSELIDLTKELIKFKSSHDNKPGIVECIDFIKGWLSASGLEYTAIESEGYPSLVITPTPGFAPVLIMAHVDVVAAGPEQFEPFEKDGKLFGRGSIDDKYAAALAMVLAKNWLKKLQGQGKTQAQMPFGIVITGDEELGGHNGAEKVMETTRCDFCIGLDGGNLDQIKIKAKGLLTLKLITRGKAAHGAQPWLGENAIDKLIEDYRVIKSFFPDKDPDHWNRTLNFGLIKAGKSFNQVPDRAEAVFDIRYTELEDPDELYARIKDAVSGELTIAQKEVMLAEAETPYLDKLCRVVEETVGKPELGFEFGASDARFCGVHAIPAIVWGAEGNQSQHTVDEHLDIASAESLYGIMDKYFEMIGG